MLGEEGSLKQIASVYFCVCSGTFARTDVSELDVLLDDPHVGVGWSGCCSGLLAFASRDARTDLGLQAPTWFPSLRTHARPNLKHQKPWAESRRRQLTSKHT